MKKVFLLFITLTFLFSGVFLVTPKSVSADPGLLGAMVRAQATDACINNIARASLSLAEEETLTFIEDEGETFTIIEDEGTYTRTEESNNSIMPFVISNFKNQVATSDSGSKMILPLGQFTSTSYGYCHTFKGHMLNVNCNINLAT